jgi:putative ABC transport system permease protein
MLQYFLKISVRSLLRYRFYTLSILLGYSIAFSFCCLIVVFLVHELNADKFNSKYNRITRLLMSNAFGEMSISSFPETLEGLMANYPEIETGTFIKWPGRVNLNFDDKSFIEEGGLLTDSEFLNVFDYRLISGNRKRCLSEPNRIVLTKSIAVKYFGNVSPIGRIINWKDQPLEVTAILDDVPSNSHMHFQFLISISTAPSKNVSLSTATYLLSKQSNTFSALEAKMNQNRKQLSNPNIEAKFQLQPLREAYFHHDFIYSYFGNIFKSRSKAMLSTFGLVALIILVITNFNFVSFSQARAMHRYKESMINEIFGISKTQSFSQFIIEAFIVLLAASLVGLLIVWLVFPSFNLLTDSSIEFSYLSNPKVWLLLLLVIISGSVMLGGISYLMYKNLIFNTNEIIVGKIKNGKRISKIMQGLAIIQLSVSIVLSALMIVTLKQASFIKNNEMGFVKENVLDVLLESIPSNSNPQLVKTAVLKNSNVISASISTGNPISGRGFYNEVLDGNEISVGTLTGDRDYITTLNFSLLQGRYFNPNLYSDTLSMVVNEKAFNIFKLKIDSLFGFYRVIGVVKDFHYGSFHEEIGPILIYYNPYQKIKRSSLHLLIRSNDLDQNLLADLKENWSAIYPDLPFQYRLLDQEIVTLHQKDFREVYLLIFCATGSIIITIFGLAGLAYFSARKKLREIAIRKIHGADSSLILLSFFKQVVYAIVISGIIAFPIVNYFGNEWLANFTYKVEWSISFFLAAVGSCFFVTVLAVIYQIIAVAKSNPISIIQNE